jgi:hypothetical protein
MVAAAAGVDWVTVATEVEALQLEYSWIKEYDPGSTSGTGTTSRTPSWP